MLTPFYTVDRGSFIRGQALPYFTLHYSTELHNKHVLGPNSQISDKKIEALNDLGLVFKHSYMVH